MPDRHGFNLLGETVRCIVCEVGGPLWRWPERKRRQHARSHRAVARRSGRDVRRQRVLLTAPPTHTSEEKEASTMGSLALLKIATDHPTRRSSKAAPARRQSMRCLRSADRQWRPRAIRFDRQTSRGAGAASTNRLTASSALSQSSPRARRPERRVRQPGGS